jgi:hypothetical protein
MSRSGEKQNVKSMKGMAHAKPNAGSESIKREEHVGSRHGGIKFGMPKGIVDHSKVRSL